MEFEALMESLRKMLEQNKQYLAMGLTDVTAYLSGDFSKRWRFRVRVYPGTQSAPGELDHHDEEVTVRVYDVPGGPAWKPQIGASWVPHPRYQYLGTQSIRLMSFSKEDDPDARRARERWEASLAETEKFANGEVKDLEELIQLPTTLGILNTTWTQIMNETAGLGPHFDTLEDMNGDYYALKWEEAGADRYRSVLRKNAAAGRALYTGSKFMLDNISSYLKLSMNIIEVLINVGRIRIDDIGTATKSLLNLDPKKWLEVVNTAIDLIKLANTRHADTLKQGVANLVEVAGEFQRLDKQLPELAAIVGTPVEWPSDLRGLDKRWEAEHS